MAAIRLANVNPLRRGFRTACAVLILALLGFSAVPAAPATAAVPDEVPDEIVAQEELPRTIDTGEYVSVALDAGEMSSFQVTVPMDGEYLFSPDTDSGDPASFQLAVSAADGTVLYDGVFGEVSLELSAGTYDLLFTASAADTLAFFLLGFIGTMTNSEEEPGLLYPGSIYGEENLEFDRYAILRLPEGPPREVLLFLDVEGENSSAFLRVEGDDIRFNSISAPEENLLSFWTGGGEHFISVDLFRETTFALVVMTGGEPETLLIDETLEDVMDVSVNQMVYQIVVDAYYTDLTVDLLWDDADVDVSLKATDAFVDADSTAFGDEVESDEVESDEYARQESATLEEVVPGVYYAIVDYFGTLDEPLEFALTVSGTPGPEIVFLENREALEVEMEANSSALYEFSVGQAGALVAVELAAADEDNTDFDINVTRRPGRFMESSRTFNASESVTFMAPAAGTYYVEVASEEAGAFTLTATEGPLAPALAVNGVTRGSAQDGQPQFYRMEIDTAGQVLSLILAGSGDTDIDLQLELLSSRGELVHSERSATNSPYEIVSLALPTPGAYEVTVTAFDGDSDFAILTRLEDPIELFQATLTVINNTQAPVCEIYVTPAGSEEEAVNQLEEDASLEAGADFVLLLEAGRYDLQAVDCDGQAVSEIGNSLLQGEMNWPLE